MNLLSELQFHWFLMLVTGIVAGAWFFYDGWSLWRSRNADRRDPLVADKRFGYVMGMIIGATGVIGVLQYHGVF